MLLLVNHLNGCSSPTHALTVRYIFGNKMNIIPSVFSIFSKHYVYFGGIGVFQVLSVPLTIDLEVFVG